MKRLFIAYLLVAIIFGACSKQKDTGFANVEPLKVEIPDEIKNNKELVDFIKSSEKSINDFAVSIENLYKEDPKLMQKDAEEMSMFEKLKLMKVAGEMAVLFGEFSMNYAEMNEELGNYELTMTNEQALALATVSETFEKRMLLLEEQIKKYQQ